METHKGYYCVIQYCPDASRAEVANVGVLLFCPGIDYIDVKISQGNDRIRRFFQVSGADIDKVNAAKRAIAARIQVDKKGFRDLEDLNTFTRTRANEVIITLPRPMKVRDAANDLDNLYKDIVGGRSARQAVAKKLEIPELDEQLRAPLFKDRITFNQRVEVPLLGHEVAIPYSYHNGTLNLIKPQLFAGSEMNIHKTAMGLAVEGDLLQQPVDETQRKFIVVSKYAEKSNGYDSRIQELFKHYKVDYVRSEDIKEFVTKVAKEAL
jgi:hypothetical protein